MANGTDVMEDAVEAEERQAWRERLPAGLRLVAAGYEREAFELAMTVEGLSELFGIMGAFKPPAQARGALQEIARRVNFLAQMAGKQTGLTTAEFALLRRDIKQAVEDEARKQAQMPTAGIILPH